jgi:hypothetical protein
MKRHYQLFRSVGCLIGSSLIVVGCGGGGGGGSGPTPPATAVVVTQANSVSVAAAGYRGASNLNDSGVNGALSAGGVILAPASGRFSIAQFAAHQLESAAGRQFSAAALPAGAIVSVPMTNCLVSGSWSASFNDADSSGTFTVGDTLSITFANCNDAGATLNGAMSMTYTAVSGTLGGMGDRNLGANFTLTNLSVTQGSLVESLTGDFALTAATTNSNQAVAVTLSGNSLSDTVNGRTETLSGYNFALTLNFTNSTRLAGTGSFAATGRLTSAALGGYVDFATPTPFSGDITLPAPMAGVLTVTGKNSSAARLTAVDSVTCTIETDANGDGTYESSTSTTWVLLAGA